MVPLHCRCLGIWFPLKDITHWCEPQRHFLQQIQTQCLWQSVLSSTNSLAAEPQNKSSRGRCVCELIPCLSYHSVIVLTYRGHSACHLTSSVLSHSVWWHCDSPVYESDDRHLSSSFKQSRDLSTQKELGFCASWDRKVWVRSCSNSLFHGFQVYNVVDNQIFIENSTKDYFLKH